MADEPNIAERETFQVTGTLFKARPETEGDDRYVYCEPSNESVDTQGEQLLQDALLKAWPDYYRLGNVDLDHISMLGPSMGMSLDEARLHEVGLPHGLIRECPIVFKAKIYRGEGRRFEKANGFWEDLTVKGRRFLPSVAGDYLPGGRENGVVKAVSWKNTGFASLPFLPVNRTVKAVSLSPLDFAKALAAGYSADTASLQGADALRRESLASKTVKVEPEDDTERTDLDEPIARYIAGLGKGGCPHAGSAAITAAGIRDHFQRCEHLSTADAARAAKRLGRLVSRHVQQSQNKSQQRAAEAA